MKTFDFTVVVWKEQDGYVSKCPELGVASCGDSISDATVNLKDIEESLTSKEKYTSHLEIAQYA